MDTKAKIENPYAFPVPNDSAVNGQEGMTLRDYFAAKAMLGVLSGNWTPREEFSEKAGSALVAEQAYRIADAMLIARQKGAPQC